MAATIRVQFINNDGAGFAEQLELPVGTTATALFSRQLGSANPSNYLIRVNRQPVAKDQVLNDGDRMTCTPTKIQGATI